MPNMLVTKNGSGRFEVLTDGITLRAGPLSVFDTDGSALVIHVGWTIISPTRPAMPAIALPVV